MTPTTDRRRDLKRVLPETFGKVPYTLMAAEPVHRHGVELKPLTVYAIAVFAALDWHGHSAFPSCTTLSLMARCSVRQVMRAIRDLLSYGFLTREGGRRGAVAVYRVHQYPQGLVWKPLTDRQRLRHSRETSAPQAEGSASQSGVGGGTSASQSYNPTPKTDRTKDRTSDAHARGTGGTGSRVPKILREYGGVFWKLFREHEGRVPASQQELDAWADDHWEEYQRAQAGDLFQAQRQDEAKPKGES